MKILFISHYCGFLGSNRSLASIIMYFRDKGIDVEVLLPTRRDFYQYLKKEGIKTYSFFFIFESLYVKKNKKYLSLPILWIYDLLAFPFLLLKIWMINPDIIYTNSTTDLFSVFIAKILRKKHIMHVREFMQEDFGGYCVLGKSIKRKIILLSDKLIFVSKAVARAVVGDIPPYGKVIYNGLPIPSGEVKPKSFDGNLRIGVVGNIDISKQQHLAISFMPEILKKYPGISLRLIGDKECPYKQKLIHMVNSMNLYDKVIFEGFIKSPEEIYKRIDVLLMCSRSEAFGRVTIEAMLRKIPVIGYAAGGTTELIDEGVTGFKFKDYGDVIMALDTIVNNKEIVNSIINNAYINAKEKYSEFAYTTNVYNFINDVNWK